MVNSMQQEIQHAGPTTGKQVTARMLSTVATAATAVSPALTGYQCLKSVSENSQNIVKKGQLAKFYCDRLHDQSDVIRKWHNE
jgi:broad-specificity NMP kinase